MNKLIVITGGTKGIGKAVIERFLAEGFDVATCARNQQELALLKEKMEADYPASKVFTAQADLSGKNQVQQFAGFVADMKRPVEILVNNTGIFIPGITYQEEGRCAGNHDQHQFVQRLPPHQGVGRRDDSKKTWRYI